MSEVDHDLRKLARLRDRFEEKANLLSTTHGVVIGGKNGADCWRSTQLFFMSPENGIYRVGNRCIIPRVTLIPKRWGGFLPIEMVGYKREARLARLSKNYLNEESVAAARRYFMGRRPDRVSTTGVSFVTGRKRTQPCLQGMTINYFPGFTNIDVLLRASEVTITLCADFHFINLVIRRSLAEWMKEFPVNVRIHLTMGYIHGQFFPILEQVLPGLKLDLKYQLHMSALKSLKLANDDEYISKWRTEKRQHGIYRRRLDDYEQDDEGRIISGPSFFDFEEIDL